MAWIKHFLNYWDLKLKRNSRWQDKVHHLKPFEVCHTYILKSEEGIKSVECTSKPQHVREKFTRGQSAETIHRMNKTKNGFCLLLQTEGWSVFVHTAAQSSRSEQQIRPCSEVEKLRMTSTVDWQTRGWRLWCHSTQTLNCFVIPWTSCHHHQPLQYKPLLLF